MLANQKKKSSFSWSKSCLKVKNPHHARIFELRKNIISYGCGNIVISFLNFVLRLLLEWLLPTNSKFLVFHDHFFSDQTLEEEEMRNEITMFPEPYEGIFIFSSNASREEPTSLDRLRHMQLNYNRTNNGHPVDLLAPPGDWPASLPKKMEKKEEATQAVAWLLLLLLIGNHLLLLQDTLNVSLYELLCWVVELSLWIWDLEFLEGLGGFIIHLIWFWKGLSNQFGFDSTLSLSMYLGSSYTNFPQKWYILLVRFVDTTHTLWLTQGK